jgi:hypothetical protein
MFLLPFAGNGKMFDINGSDLCSGIFLPASTLTITGEVESAFPSMELIHMAYRFGLGKSRYVLE